MKRLFAVLAIGLGVHSAQAEEPKDTVSFLGLISEESWYNGTNDLKSFESNDTNARALFGVTVKGLFNKEVWHGPSCKELLENDGETSRSAMKDILKDRESLSLFMPFSDLKGDEAIDIQSMSESVDDAVNNALQACSPNIM